MDDFQLDAMHNVAWIASSWKKRNNISKVRELQGNEFIHDLENWNQGLSEPRMSSKRTARVDLFFIVETVLELRGLVDLDCEECKRNNVWIKRKHALNEYANRVGFLTSPIANSANLNDYDNMMKKVGKSNEGEVEVKRNMACEGPERE